ncbi:hypothetical protein H5410_045036 [Solanum commersonii]|uniref:Uncharacterized protein n=1 Tax=Solanum commersonii TaxID=4109 RepID=A0A9J5X9W4_SOLCO|nr:hypothetical protein H5410_045036 [Solanum commersonii]
MLSCGSSGRHLHIVEVVQRRSQFMRKTGKSNSIRMNENEDYSQVALRSQIEDKKREEMQCNQTFHEDATFGKEYKTEHVAIGFWRSLSIRNLELRAPLSLSVG